jgi:ornithine cyclodeaminase/alanine dehydrogenase-like protein (mu-crystallin family)
MSFSAKMSSHLGIEVTPAESAREAIRGQSIVITCTTAREPVVDGSWIEPGVHLNVAGSNFLSKAEVDVETIRRASVVAVDSIDQARMEAGDLLPAIERGVINWESVTELGRIVAGQVPGRTSTSDITLFKSVGIAIWDVAAALRVYSLAVERGSGDRLELWPGKQ